MARKSDTKFVKWLQERLYQLGYDDVKQSGTNDPFTQDAIRDIQQQFNLRETGTATKEFIDQIRTMKPMPIGGRAVDVMNAEPRAAGGPPPMPVMRPQPPQEMVGGAPAILAFRQAASSGPSNRTIPPGYMASQAKAKIAQVAAEVAASRAKAKQDFDQFSDQITNSTKIRNEPEALSPAPLPLASDPFANRSAAFYPPTEKPIPVQLPSPPPSGLGGDQYGLPGGQVYPSFGEALVGIAKQAAGQIANMLGKPEEAETVEAELNEVLNEWVRRKYGGMPPATPQIPQAQQRMQQMLMQGDGGL